MEPKKTATTDDVIGYHRANRVGVLLLIMTLCLYGVPTIFFLVLSHMNIDITADTWGLTPLLYRFVYITMYVLMLGLPLLIGGVWLLPKSTYHLSPLNLSHDRKLCVVLCGVALCLVANIAAALFSGVLFSAGITEPSLTAFGNGDILLLFADLIIFAIVPAIMEEWLLRGIVLQTLRPVGRGAAVAISALMFSLMHGNLAQAPYALLMGLILGAVFVHTDDLRLTMVIHALANGLSVITAFLLQYFNRDFAMFWELVILIVALMMGGVAGLWLLRHPLERSRPKHTATAAARAKALIKAPFLWVAVAVMIVMMVIYA